LDTHSKLGSLNNLKVYSDSTSEDRWHGIAALDVDVMGSGFKPRVSSVGVRD